LQNRVLEGISYSLVYTFLLNDVSFSYNALRSSKQTDKQTVRSANIV